MCVCVCVTTESLAIIATGSRWKYSKPWLIQFTFLILSGNNRNGSKTSIEASFLQTNNSMNEIIISDMAEFRILVKQRTISCLHRQALQIEK